MNEKIFWDAWAFIALADKTYSFHSQALAIKQNLQRQDTYLITTEAVLSEVGNMFSRSSLKPLAVEQVKYVKSVVTIHRGKIVTIDTRIWERAWELYHARPDKDWGHTDCISFVVMQELGISKAFTGDKHFEQAGFTRLVQM